MSPRRFSSTPPRLRALALSGRFLSLLALVGCQGCETGRASVGATADDGGRADPLPFREDWHPVIDQPFSALDADGVALIGSLEIGGELHNDNFANRGDVIVNFADTDRIMVEMRRFTMAPTAEIAQRDYDAVEIWAYDTSGAPKKPSEMDEEDDCVDLSGVAQWRSGCKIRVYYDGQAQLARSGADLRVTLPADYIGELSIITDDNDADADYQNRGNVCIAGLRGNANVQLGSGVAYVTAAADLSEIPHCPEADVAACDAAGWDVAMCPCLTGSNPFFFGQVRASTLDGSAADMVVDLPPELWSTVSLSNDSANQVRAPSGNACADGDGACCDAIVEPSAGVFRFDEKGLGDESLRQPWRTKGEINHPGGNAIVGAGFSVSLTSGVCQAVPATEHPDDFGGVGAGTDQETSERGNLTVCSGCIRDTTCADLLPGG